MVSQALDKSTNLVEAYSLFSKLNKMCSTSASVVFSPERKPNCSLYKTLLVLKKCFFIQCLKALLKIVIKDIRLQLLRHNLFLLLKIGTVMVIFMVLGYVPVYKSILKSKVLQ